MQIFQCLMARYRRNLGSIPSLSINDITVAEDAGLATFTVTKTGSGACSVDWATAAGVSHPATTGSEYTAASGTLNFLAGDTTKAINITITSTTNYEFTEEFVVNLSNPVGCTITDGQGVASLTDVSGFPNASAVTSPTASEGSNITFRVDFPRLAEFSTSHTYTLGGTATAGVDYNFTPVSILNNIGASATAITASSGGGSFTVPVNTSWVDITFALLADGSAESAETIILTVDGTANGTGTITDVPPPTISTVSSPTAEEGNNLVFTVTRTGTSGVSLNYAFSVGGTASAPSDYTATPTLSNGVAISGGDFVVPAAVTSFTATFATVVNGDNGETVILTVGGVAGTGTITQIGFTTFGDSQSTFPMAALAIDTTSTTDTLNVADGTADGQVFIAPPASGTFTKTVHKTGTATSKVFSKSRIGYVRLDNTTGQGVKIGNASLNLTQRSVIGMLVRMDAAQLTSYSGDFKLLKTSQVGPSGNPYLTLGVGGATSGTQGALVRKFFYCEREGLSTSFANVSLYEVSEMTNVVYGGYLDPFGAKGTARLSNKWVWLWMLGSDITDTIFSSASHSDDGSAARSQNSVRLAHAENGTHPSEKGISSRWSKIPTFNTQTQFTGEMSGTTTLTVSAMISGEIKVGAVLSGTGVASNRSITAPLTGTPGGVGTYTVSGAAMTFGPTTVTCAGITPAFFDGSDADHPLLDFVLGSGSTGTGKVVDIARVIKLSTFPCGFALDATRNIGYDIIGQLSHGIHPATIEGLMTGDDFCLDFGALPAIATNINSPTYNPAEDGPIVQVSHGTDASDAVLSVTNQRIA